MAGTSCKPSECPHPTRGNACLGLLDGRNFKVRRLDSKSADWGKQGIYFIKEPGYTYHRKERPILYVGRGDIGERLRQHFQGTDGQKIGEHLHKKKDVDGRGGDRFQLEGIKVHWKVMCKECNKQEEESFIQCVADLEGYRPRFNKIKGNAKKRKK